MVAEMNAQQEVAKEETKVPLQDGLYDSLRDASTSLHHTLQRRVPRLYYLVLQLFIPLTIMVSMAFFFGRLLALAEKDHEIAQNDGTILGVVLDYVDYVEQQTMLQHNVLGTIRQCAAPLDTPVFNVTEPVLECVTKMAPSLFSIKLIEFYLLTEGVGEHMSFNWIRCDFYQGDLGELNVHHDTNYVLQLAQYMNDYLLDMERWEAYFRENDHSPSNLTSLPKYQYWHQAAALATGGKSCGTHVPGGAIFWFTIMTTIGYGNTAPVTSTGR